jgi:hypothetical protein
MLSLRSRLLLLLLLLRLLLRWLLLLLLLLERMAPIAHHLQLICVSGSAGRSSAFSRDT